MIEFGRNGNQVSHTFRHVETAGLPKSEVERAVETRLRSIASELPEGAHTGEVLVKGIHLEFRAYKFSNGDIHVGRITLR